MRLTTKESETIDTEFDFFSKPELMFWRIEERHGGKVAQNGAICPKLKKIESISVLVFVVSCVAYANREPQYQNNISLTNGAPQFDKNWIADQFTLHRQRLIQVVRFRLDQRLYGRVDSEDVLQEAYLDAVKRLPYFHTRMSVFVQIRQLLLQTLTDVHRRHLAVQARNASREVSLNQSGFPSRSSVTLTRWLQAGVASPSFAIKQAETSLKLNQAIESLNKIDCEILLMRHFEDLTNKEVAETLDISPVAASQRYL